MAAGHSQISWVLTSLILPGVLAGDWVVHVPADPVCVARGSSVVLPCSYGFPEGSDATGHRHRVLSEMWCLGQSHCITPRYVYHSEGVFPEPAYLGRVEYLGDVGTRDCSLRISDARVSDSGVYVFRFITDHPLAKLPGQPGLTLLVINTSVLVSPAGDILEGGPVTLTCSSNANPPVENYTWFKTNGATTSLKGTGQNHSIPAISTEDSGQYTCMIQHCLRTQNTTVTITVLHAGSYQSSMMAIGFGTLAVLVAVSLAVIACIGRKVLSTPHQQVSLTESSL